MDNKFYRTLVTSRIEMSDSSACMASWHKPLRDQVQVSEERSRLREAVNCMLAVSPERYIERAT